MTAVERSLPQELPAELQRLRRVPLFRRGADDADLPYGDALIGVNICEDIWYPGGPTQVQALAGAQVIINISASPYHAGKGRDRERMLATRAEDNAVALAYVNLVGGQDELVFDGQSLVINESGRIVARGKLFEEDLIVADINAERVFKERLHDPRRRQERIDLCGGRQRRADRAESTSV